MYLKITQKGKKLVFLEHDILDNISLFRLSETFKTSKCRNFPPSKFDSHIFSN